MDTRYACGARAWHRAAQIALTVLLAAAAGRAEVDRSRYMSPDELKPGMKGFGRTVMSGTRIDTFQLEVIDVVQNMYYAGQDVILVRCSGLNLEHSGIIGGMSGSPCFVVDASGQPRMIGAVAYGWTFNKDPVCGLQPITQMLPVAQVRAPKSEEKAGADGPTGDRADAEPTGADPDRGVFLGELIARGWDEPLDDSSRFSIFNDEILEARRHRPAPRQPAEREFGPLAIPFAVAGASDRTLGLLRRFLEPRGITLLPVGGGGSPGSGGGANVRLEPGSVLCVALMTGDMTVAGTGTCTHVAGDRILGFGHSMTGEGSVKLPLATGKIHTVISSVARSSKIGSPLDVVGTLYGDENTGVFGVSGDMPRMVPLDIIVNDVHGQRTYHYDLVHEEYFTAYMMAGAAAESVFAHSDPPLEHTIRYNVEVEFEDYGTYRASNFTSQRGTFSMLGDLVLSTHAMMDTPFVKSANTIRARAEVTVEKGARTAELDQATLDRHVFKPGETVTVRVRWLHYRRQPTYTEASYDLKLPDDLPDGVYELTLCSATAHLQALRKEKPYLFYARNLKEILAGLEILSKPAFNQLYMRLGLPTGGVALVKREMPDLPSFRRKILADTGRTDFMPYTDALVVTHETDFVVNGKKTFKIKVDRRADQ